MGRPFAVIGFTMFASLLFIGVLGVNAAIILFAAALLLLPIFLIVKSLRKYKAYICALIVIALSSALYFSAYTYFYKPQTKLIGKQISVSGEICELPVREYDRVYYEIKVDEINAKKLGTKYKIRLSCEEELDAKPFDRVSFKGNAYALGSTSVYSELNYLSKGEIIGLNTTEKIKVTSNNNALKPLKYYLLEYRQSLADSLYSAMPAKNAALCIAVLMGEKSYLSANDLNNINTVGISHLICVSGLHLSMWGFALLWLFRRLHMPRTPRYILAGALILLFMAFCGFTPSVVRSGIMFLIFIAAEIIYAEPDGLNSLGIASFVILLNPFNALSIGFILSFLSTLSILTLGVKSIDKAKIKLTSHNKNRLTKATFSVLEILIISLCVNLFCLPISILVFGKVSFLGIIANVLILPFASLLVISSGICAIFGSLGSIFSIIASPVSFIASAVSHYVIRICDIMAHFKIGVLNVSGTVAVLFVAIAFILIALILLFSKSLSKKTVKGVCLIMVAVIIFGTAINYLSSYKRCNITAYSCDDKICLSIEQGDKLVLVDCGNYYNILYKLDNLIAKRWNSDIDCFIISGDNKYESGYAANVLNHYPVKRVVMPVASKFAANFAKDFESEIIETNYAEIPVSDDLKITFVSGQASAVFIEYKSQKVLFLSSADIDIFSLPEKMRSYNYLIIRGKTNKTIVNSSLNGIIELSAENKYASNASALKKAGYIYYETAGVSDIELTLCDKTSTLGRKNKWLQ